MSSPSANILLKNKCEHLIAQPHLRQCYEYVNWIPIWFLIGQTSQFRNNQNHLFWVGERLGDYILWKIMQPLPSLHNLWKFQLSIIYGFRKSKNHLFWGWWEVAWLYFVKNHATSSYSAQSVKISTFHHLQFRTSKNHLFWAGERMGDFILWKITQPLPILHNMWKFQLPIIYDLEEVKLLILGLVKGSMTLFCVKSSWTGSMTVPLSLCCCHPWTEGNDFCIVLV